MTINLGMLALALATATASPVGITREPAPWHGIEDVRYDVTFDRETAASRLIHVEMSFMVHDEDAIVLSLPAWTPGSYQLDNFAKHIRSVSAHQGSEEIRWDKKDFDTWRVYPSGTGRVSIAFDYNATELDTGMAWSQADIAFFNGTALFFYPEDSGYDFESTVRIHTEADWDVATGLTSTGDNTFSAADYHELVDMPTFVGAFDMDGREIAGTSYRLATYPVGVMAGAARERLWSQIEAMMPPMIDVVDDVPWEEYTTLMVFDGGFGGGSALEHSNSHLGIYHPQFIGSPILASITAHEIFHAWNVKRLRPADMWPYDYGRQMPTELLWISEGITDYYADLALVRGEIVPPAFFYQVTQGKIETVAGTVPVALEDASLSAWIGPTDGTASIYYPKGSLAGFMLDIIVRDATDNARSLDDVMKRMYDDAYRQGKGFTESQWWSALRDISGVESFRDFHNAYIDGREAFPWEEVLPLAGMELVSETEAVARLGISTQAEDDRVRIATVVAGSSAAGAGVMIGDILIGLGGRPVEDASFGAQFRTRFRGEPAGTPLEYVVLRDGVEVTLQGELQFADVTTVTLSEDPKAGPKALRIRNGILTGATGNRP